MAPRQNQSGNVDRRYRIMKAGAPFLRRILVERAQMVLSKGSVDIDTR